MADKAKAARTIPWLGILVLAVVLLLIAAVSYQLGVKHGESGMATTVKRDE